MLIVYTLRFVYIIECTIVIETTSGYVEKVGNFINKHFPDCFTRSTYTGGTSSYNVSPSPLSATKSSPSDKKSSCSHFMSLLLPIASSWRTSSIMYCRFLPFPPQISIKPNETWLKLRTNTARREVA